MAPNLCSVLNSETDPDEFHDNTLITPSEYYSIEEFSNISSHNSISLYSTNCRSLLKNKPNYDILFHSLSQSHNFSFDLLTFTETWLDDNLMQLVNFNGYSKQFKHKHKCKEGGGLAIFVKDNIRYKVRNDLFVPREYLDHCLTAYLFN
jgi:hypothetical protein